MSLLILSVTLKKNKYMKFKFIFGFMEEGPQIGRQITKQILSIFFFVRKYEYSNSFQLKIFEICLKIKIP